MDRQPSLFAREDTLLGVCEGLGQELGVNPLFLRLAFALGLFWSLSNTVAVYLFMGVALMLFRWAFPLRRAASIDGAVAVPPAGSNDDEAVTLAEAA